MRGSAHGSRRLICRLEIHEGLSGEFPLPIRQQPGGFGEWERLLQFLRRHVRGRGQGSNGSELLGKSIQPQNLTLQ